MTSVLLSTKEFSSHVPMFNNNTAYCTWTHIYFTDTEIYVIQLKSLKWWHKTVMICKCLISHLMIPDRYSCTSCWFHLVSFQYSEAYSNPAGTETVAETICIYHFIRWDHLKIFKKRLHSIPHSSLLRFKISIFFQLFVIYDIVSCHNYNSSSTFHYDSFQHYTITAGRNL